MNKKKIAIIGIIVLALIALAVALFFIFKKDDDTSKKSKDKKEETKITITFDVDGGSEVENITVKKGTKFKLPTTEKKGYFFQGWYDGETFYTDDDTDKIVKDMTLKAYWATPDTPEEDVTLKVVFDSKGGSKVKDMTFKCSDGAATLKNLPKASKDGYNFMSWEDKNGKSILDGAKIVCDGDLKLYATYEKKVSYTCPDGYKLEGTKCVQTVAAKTKCGERGFDYNGKCVTITGTARKDTQKTCPKEHVTYKSFSEYVDGKVVNWGVIGCAYYKTPDTAKAECESHGFKWVTPENACYVKWVSNNTINTCDHLDGYAYITNPNSYEGVNGLNGGCYPVTEKTKYCESGYELNVANCVKTIDATQE